MQQVIDGTAEEIAALLQSETFAGLKLRLIVDPDEDDYTAGMSDPPDSVRDSGHLEQLLIEGLASPARVLSDSIWSELHQRAHGRLESKNA